MLDLLENNKQNKQKQAKASKGKHTDTESDTDTDTDTESDIRESTREKTPPRKEKHGENCKVELTDDEFNRLAEQMGVSKRDEYIEARENKLPRHG